MIFYRPQRGTLDEAMEEVKQFDTINEMLDYLVADYNHAFSKSDIYISYYCYDERIDWDTYIVCIGRYGDEDYMKKYHSPQAIGFCRILFEPNILTDN